MSNFAFLIAQNDIKMAALTYSKLEMKRLLSARSEEEERLTTLVVMTPYSGVIKSIEMDGVRV